MSTTATQAIVNATKRGQDDAAAMIPSVIRVAKRHGRNVEEALIEHRDWARQRRDDYDARFKINHAYLCGYAATASDVGPTDMTSV